MQNLSKTMMKLDDAADFMRVSTRTVTRLIKSGDLTAHKVGRQWRIARTDLQDFLNRQARHHSGPVI